ncbi:MAG TPA: ATP-binding protein [Anaeromyxobacteraceae bacterium]|nr:ATP-binding protein [Anaeromyxobacteraceae bacterium]
MAFWRFRRRGADGATEQRLRALVGQAPSIFFVIDRQGRVLMAEGRLLKALGRRAGSDVGSSVFELFKDVGWALDGVRRAQAGRTVTVRGPVDDRFYEARFAPVRGDDGAVVEVVGMASDATELHGAEERLRRQAFRLEALAEASRVFASGLDYRTTLDTVARRLSELIGDGALIRMISDDGAWLVPVAVYHDDPERAALRKRMLQGSPQRAGEGLTASVLATGRTLRVEHLTPEFVHARMKQEYWAYLEGASSLLIAPLIHRRQTLGHITLLRDQGRPAYTHEDETLLEDLAHRAAQAIENARLYGQSQAAVVARDEFLSIASHELRTPLTALRLALENMRRVAAREAQGAPSAHVERVLGAAERAGQRLEKLVEALLDVSRIHMGRLELDVEEVDLGAVVAEAVSELGDELAQSGSTVSVVGEPTLGWWDRLRLGQVVTNLLSNAVKYGAGKPIEIRYGLREGRAWLWLRDHGIGIDPADQRHIFERFERAVSSQNYGGLGLGLYIVKRILEAHGGSVEVESAPGEGAAFTVVLPRRPAVPVERDEGPGEG